MKLNRKETTWTTTALSVTYEVKHQRSFVKSYTWIQCYTDVAMSQFSITKNERVSVFCLTSNEHGFGCNMKRGDKELEWVKELVLFNTKWPIFQKQVTFNAMMIRPLCTKPTRLVRFLNFNSLKHLSPGIHVVPLGHIILILSQPVLIALTP